MRKRHYPDLVHEEIPSGKINHHSCVLPTGSTKRASVYAYIAFPDKRLKQGAEENFRGLTRVYMVNGKLTNPSKTGKVKEDYSALLENLISLAFTKTKERMCAACTCLASNTEHWEVHPLTGSGGLLNFYPM